MKPAAFPSWAPRELLRLRSDMGENGGLVGEGEDLNTLRGRFLLIETLCTDSRMESVWRALRKRFKPPAMDYSLRLWHDIVWEHSAWEKRPKLTKAQSVALHKKIIKHASALAPLLWETMDNRLQFIPYGNLRYEDGLEVMEDGIALSKVAESAQVECAPSLPAVLDVLAARAQHRITSGKTITQPNSKAARLHHFIEFIADQFRKHYGTPLHAHVAMVATVVMGANETGDSVRLFLAQKRKRSSTGNKKQKKLQKRTG